MDKNCINLFGTNLKIELEEGEPKTLGEKHEGEITSSRTGSLSHSCFIQPRLITVYGETLFLVQGKKKIVKIAKAFECMTPFYEHWQKICLAMGIRIPGKDRDLIPFFPGEK